METPRKSDKRSHHPQNLTRRLFIKRTATAGAATAFGLAMVSTAKADLVTGVTGYIVDVQSGTVNADGATQQQALENLVIALTQAGATFTNIETQYDPYYFHLEALDPARLLNPQGTGTAQVVQLPNGNWQATTTGPVSFQIQTKKLVEN